MPRVALEIVGTYFADEHEGDVVMCLLDTLRALDPGVDPGDFDIRLADGAAGRTLRACAATRWARGALVADARLEDVVGNSVTRVFGRDLLRPEDDPASRVVPGNAPVLL